MTPFYWTYESEQICNDAVETSALNTRIHKYRTCPEEGSVETTGLIGNRGEETMRIYSRLAVAAVALAVSLPMAFGQNATPTAPPPPPATPSGQQFHPGGMRWRGAMDHQGPRWGRDNWRGMHRQFMLARLVKDPTFRQRLGITPEQAQKIENQTFDFRKAQIDNWTDLAVKRLELGRLLSADNPDRSAIHQKLQEISAARLAQAQAMVDFHLDMRAALTPEQRQKLQEMRHHFLRHRGFGPHGAGGSGSGMHSPNTAG